MKRYAFKSTACFAEHEGGGWVEYSDHLAAIQQLTDRLAQVERERDELKRGKSCDGCAHLNGQLIGDVCAGCIRMCNEVDNYKPRDPSAAQGG